MTTDSVLRSGSERGKRMFEMHQGRKAFEEEIIRKKEEGSPLPECFFLAEIENARTLRTELGLEEYDRMLNDFIDRISATMKDGSVATAYYDSLYLIGVPGINETEVAKEYGNQLVKELDYEFMSNGRRYDIRITVGAAFCTEEDPTGYKKGFDKSIKALENAWKRSVRFVLYDEERNNRRFNVMIVEDQELVRKYYEDTVNKSRHFNLAFSISNADLADIYCQKNKIDLIIMDVYTDYGANGLQAAARIKANHPEIKIIIVTSMPEFSYLEQARVAGVESFVYKELNYDSFLDIMERTMDGESIYPDETPEVQLGQASSRDFTYRELEILREITTGDTNEEIAERMFLSVSTVKTHIMNLMQKTGFKSRTELAIKARESGLVIK